MRGTQRQPRRDAIAHLTTLPNPTLLTSTPSYTGDVSYERACVYSWHIKQSSQEYYNMMNKYLKKEISIPKDTKILIVLLTL